MSEDSAKPGWMVDIALDAGYTEQEIYAMSYDELVEVVDRHRSVVTDPNPR